MRCPSAPGIPTGRTEMSWLCVSLLWVRPESLAAAAGTLTVCLGNILRVPVLSTIFLHPCSPGSAPSPPVPCPALFPLTTALPQAPAVPWAGTALPSSPVPHLQGATVAAEPSWGGQGLVLLLPQQSSTPQGIYRSRNVIPLPNYSRNRLSVCHRREDFNATVFTAGMKVTLPRCFP